MKNDSLIGGHEIFAGETDMSEAADRPYYRHLGVEIVETSAESCVVRLPVNRDLGNARGDVHGGAIAGLLDIALSRAARATAPPGSGVATVQMTVHYLASGQGELLAEARVVRGGRTIVTAEGFVTDRHGTRIAQALGSWRVLTKR